MKLLFREHPFCPGGEDKRDERLDLGNDERVLIAAHLDVREPGSQLRSAIFKRKRVLAPLPVAGEREAALHQISYLLEMGLSIRRGVEAPLRLQDAPDFGECTRALGDVVKHMVGDHNVEGSVLVWNRLRVDDLKGEARSALRKIVFRLLQHALREVGEHYLVARRDAVRVLLPEMAGTTAQFENTAACC